MAWFRQYSDRKPTHAHQVCYDTKVLVESKFYMSYFNYNSYKLAKWTVVVLNMLTAAETS